ncbi:MAG: hypothetical protein P4L50_19245 [Anaerolineaceae bacterium]|nr:hypothetical protein [Anaerolineaceae bacterium]
MRRFNKNIGLFLLAIWLIAWGLFELIPVLNVLGPILAILAIAAGVFILLNR